MGAISGDEGLTGPFPLEARQPLLSFLTRGRSDPKVALLDQGSSRVRESSRTVLSTKSGKGLGPLTL